MSETRDAWMARVLGLDLAAVSDRAAQQVAKHAAQQAAQRAAQPAAQNAAPEASGESPGKVRGGVVDYAKSRLAWVRAKSALRTDLQSLKDTILARYRDTLAYAEIAARIGSFDRVLTDFADDLSVVLDDALNATEQAQRQKHHAAAAKLIGEYLARAQGDSFIARLEANPYVPFRARAVLVQTLGELSRQIA